MRNIYRYLNRQVQVILLAILAGVCIILASCSSDENTTPPVITKVTKLDKASIVKDSTFTETFPGQMIVIHGENFNKVLTVFFNGKPAYFNSNYTTSKTIIIEIPADAETAATNPDVPNTIRVVTAAGEASFNFRLLVSGPEIYSVSNELPNPGSYITLYGKRFYVIEKVLFPGNVEGTNVTVKGDSIITVQVPQDIVAGDLILVNEFGRDTVSFGDRTGMIADFDGLNPYGGGATAVQNDPSAYPGNQGYYVTMEGGPIAPWNNEFWNAGRQIYLNDSQLLPAAELGNSVSNYVMKFEIYVKEPWASGSLMINPTADWSHLARYRPWEVGTKSKPFITSGWRTVTIPLNMFKSDGSWGSPAAALSDLLGTEGKGPLAFMFWNDSPEKVNKFAFALDNVRIVRQRK